MERGRGRIIRPRKSTPRSRNPCEACRISHLRCIAEWPCPRCEQRGIECVRPNRSRFVNQQPKIGMAYQSLTDPSQDPSGIFTAIGAPLLPNTNAVWYWLDVKCHDQDSQAGWLGGLKETYVDLMRSQEPVLISFTAYWVLRLQQTIGQLDDTQGQLINRARSRIIHEFTSLQRINGCTLVVVAFLALMAVRNKDITAGEFHLQSLRTMIRDVPVTLAEWLFTWGTDYRISSYLMTALHLPFYLPPGLKTTFPLSPSQLSLANSRAAENAAQLRLVLKDDYLVVLDIFENVHRACAVRLSPSGAPPWGQGYVIAYHALSWLERSRREPMSPATRCRTLLSLVFVLLSWRFLNAYVPSEGLIHTTILGYAKVLCKKLPNNKPIVSEWPQQVNLDVLLWAAAILFVESSAWRPNDREFWQTILRFTAEAQRDVYASKDHLEQHVSRWPYPLHLYDSLVERLWTSVRMKESDDEDLHSVAPASESTDLAVRTYKSVFNGPVML